MTDCSAVLEEALIKALEYERKVRDVYRAAIDSVEDEVGHKVFEVLADEEQGHVDYLEHKLEVLRDTGELSCTELESTLPTREAIEAGIARLEKNLELRSEPRPAEQELLRRALAVEQETSDFYKKMVGELPKEGQDFFFPFLTIEDGHVAIVQAELDAVSQMGFWFDIREFDLEAG